MHMLFLNMMDNDTWIIEIYVTWTDLYSYTRGFYVSDGNFVLSDAHRFIDWVRRCNLVYDTWFWVVLIVIIVCLCIKTIILIVCIVSRTDRLDSPVALTIYRGAEGVICSTISAGSELPNNHHSWG